VSVQVSPILLIYGAGLRSLSGIRRVKEITAIGGNAIGFIVVGFSGDYSRPDAAKTIPTIQYSLVEELYTFFLSILKPFCCLEYTFTVSHARE
jgi:hypothetical protein